MTAFHCLATAAVLALGTLAQPPAKPPKAPPPPPQAKEAKPMIVASNSLGFIIQRGTEQGIEVAEEGRGWVIRDGEMTIKSGDLPNRSHPIDPKLQISRFAVTVDTVVVKLNISPADRTDVFTKAVTNADKSRPPTLVDTLGRKYEAVGFVYQDSAITRIRYTKGTPLKDLSDAPSFSRTTPDRHLTLVFSVSLGVQIKEIRIGDAVLETYDPPLKCDQPQK